MRGKQAMSAAHSDSTRNEYLGAMTPNRENFIPWWDDESSVRAPLPLRNFIEPA